MPLSLLLVHDFNIRRSWTRREINPAKEKVKPIIKKKHLRSPSRSRSPSPAESSHSHRSSRGRSRSRSLTPATPATPAAKRRRRDSDSIAPRSRTPGDRGRAGWVPRPRRNPVHSRSPSPSQTPDSLKGRRRSLSSASSSSEDRSPSRTPPNRPRTVHRLPTSTSAVNLSPTTTRTSGNNYHRHNGPHRNGKHQTNYKYTNVSDLCTGAYIKLTAAKNERRSNFAHSSSVEVMPPPDTIPVSHTSRPTNDRESNRTLGKQGRSPARESKIGITGSPPTRVTHRNAGFKPINQTNQTSSSLKKFFPGDDEDMDLASDDHPSDAPMTSESGPDVTKASDDGRYQRNGVLEDRRARSPDAKAELSPNLHDRPSSRRSLMENKDALKIASLPCTPSETVHVREGASPSATTSRELYNILSQVGEGTFGKVYKAQNTVTKVHVALKRIRMEAEKDGFPVTAMREIKLLQSLRHENVVRLYEMMVSNGNVFTLIHAGRLFIVTHQALFTWSLNTWTMT